MELIASGPLGRKLFTVPRTEWGASKVTETFIKKRYTAGPLEKICLQAHHTAGADSDSTPNAWKYASATAYMKKLETIRPDLGPLPYSENLAVAEDGLTVWLFEGRGLSAVGAHTYRHNRHGHGIGVLGNMNGVSALDTIVWALQTRGHDLKYNRGFVNLGSELSPNGWQVWGHRDSKATTCPGNLLYPQLETIDLDAESEIEMPFLPLRKGDGIGELVDKKSDVAAIQGLMNRTFDSNLVTAGEFNDAMRDAIIDVFEGANGEIFTGNMFDDLIAGLIERRVIEHLSVDPHGGSSGNVDAAINVHSADPDAHHE